MVGEAIQFLRDNHPTVLQMLAREYLSSASKRIEDWLKAERNTWGLRLVSLLLRMNIRWEEEDLELLRDSWVGIVASALKSEKLVDS